MAALNESEQEHDDGHHEQDVNEPANGGTGYKAEEPQNNEDESNDGDHEIKSFRGDE